MIDPSRIIALLALVTLALLTLAISLAGCGALLRNPVPPELTPVASIPGSLRPGEDG